jgi:hypothetical protein
VDKKRRAEVLDAVKKRLDLAGVSYSRMSISADTWDQPTVVVHGAVPGEADRMRIREDIWLDVQAFVLFRKF